MGMEPDDGGFAAADAGGPFSAENAPSGAAPQSEEEGDVHRDAEEAERLAREEEAAANARWAKEEEERRRNEEIALAKLREKAEAARLAAEELERRRLEEEAAERARLEAEERERRRLAEEAAAERTRRDAEAARLAAEESERRRLEEEAAERARLEAEERERRRLAEEAAAEQARRDAEAARLAAEELERRRLEEEAAERARLEAEERERRRLAEEAAAERARRDAEAARLAAEEAAERRRREEEAAERVRRETEALERRRVAEEAAVERARREAEAARLAAEEAERRRVEEEEARRAAEELERRRAEEESEKARREAEASRIAELELRRREAVAAERARKLAEEAERAKQLAQKAERARREAGEEARRREADDRERRRREASGVGAEPFTPTENGRDAANARPSAPPPVPAAPPLEVDNPYWQKPPEIFDVLSGAPHATAMAATPEYVGAPEKEPAMPVTMAEGSAPAPHGSSGSGVGDWEEPGRAPDETVPVPPEKRMYIVMVTPEVAPCAKVGGLGDVILGLGRELMKRGHGVEVICPMYSGMRYDLIEDLHEEYGELWSPHYNEWRAEKVFQGRVEGGLQVNFITGGAYTDRPNIYGYDDDLQRFAYFSRQALEFMYKTNRRPEVIHCHDWATGLVPAILWGVYEKLGWTNSRVVYTIHNNECQGLCGFGDKLLGLVGLDVKECLRPDRMQDDAHKNCINMMKGGIVYSNFVTTVSPTYAAELKTAAGGRGLQTTIAKNSVKIGGVLNGLDFDSWNPSTDGKLSARYSVGDDFFEKYKNKTALREWLGMWDGWKPIISVVTRLTHQKGLDLIRHAIFTSQKLQAQFVLLGSAPDPRVNNEFLALQHQLRDNRDINLYIGYHEDLARLIYAGSDIFLVPSLYEPCGLTQMISLRYGTVPVVRETGGLMDTVFDVDNSGRGLNDANGFTFRDPTPTSLDYGLERAVRLWYENPEAFNRLARNGMRYDYSWRHPAEHYENIYNYIKA